MNRRLIQFRIIGTIFLFFLGMFYFPIFFLVAYLFISYDLFIKIYQNVKKMSFFDENLLMVLSSVGAICLGEYMEGILIVWLYQLGEFLFDTTIDRSKESIIRLLDLRIDQANLKKEKEMITVDSKNVKIGEIIVVKPGERIPLDGIVLEGNSMLDYSSLTGESVPKKVKKDDVILSGCINLSSLLEIKVTKTYSHSTANKILKMIEEASDRKSPSEKFITKFAKVYTPVIILVALFLFLFPVLFYQGNISIWLYRSLVFVASACPCALVISIPLCYFCGLGVASKNKILIKGSSELEKVNDIDIVAFDKTGTLTKGNFKITKIIPYYKKRDEFMKYLAYAEYYSNHPIANVIKAEYKGSINKEIIREYKEIPGQGISLKINDEHVLVGNSTLMEKNHVDFPNIKFLGTILFVALNQDYIGTVVIGDEIKKSAVSISEKLKEIGIKTTAIISGDSEEITKKIGKKLKIDRIFYGLLPHDKIQKIKDLKKEGTVLFIGDGLNDAPVMLEADLSVSMGTIGSDASIEASDIILMNDDLNHLITLRKIAKKTKRIVSFNIFFSITIKMIIMVLGAAGIATIGSAVFADVGVALLVILNALRIFKQTY